MGGGGGGLRHQDIGLTCFHHACQGVAEAWGLGSKDLHVVVHSAEEVRDKNGVNVSSHKRLQGWASNWKERVYSSYNRIWKKVGTLPRWTVAIQLFFSCPGFHGRATPAPSSAETCTPDGHAGAFPRGLVLFSNTIHSLVLTPKIWSTSPSIAHHIVRPSQWSYYALTGTGALPNWSRSLWPLPKHQLVPRRRASGSSSKIFHGHHASPYLPHGETACLLRLLL